MSAVGSSRGLRGRAGPGTQVRPQGATCPRGGRLARGAAQPARILKTEHLPYLPQFHHWVGGGGNREVGGPTSAPPLLLPFRLLLVTLPCLPAPLQPRVRVPVARNPGLGHGGTTGAVWAVRCCLLPPGAALGTPPPHIHICMLVPISWLQLLTLAHMPSVTSVHMPCMPDQLLLLGPAAGHRPGQSPCCRAGGGLICTPAPAEYLPLCPAGRGGRAAAGGCCADRSRAQWACPGEVRAVPFWAAASCGGPCEGTG